MSDGVSCPGNFRPRSGKNCPPTSCPADVCGLRSFGLAFAIPESDNGWTSSDFAFVRKTSSHRIDPVKDSRREAPTNGSNDDSTAFPHSPSGILAPLRNVPAHSLVRAWWAGVSRPLFLQVHTFYGAYLAEFLQRHQSAGFRTHRDVVQGMLDDAYGHNHMFAPAMERQGFRGLLVVANDPWSQTLWWNEFVGKPMPPGPIAEETILRAQIEGLKPEVLYLADPITYNRGFIESLVHKPRLVVGWRAADVPQGVDWHGFDIILSGLAAMREHALRIGAREAIDFYPGFEPAYLPNFGPRTQETDVVFCGSVNPSQHEARSETLEFVLDSSKDARNGFSLALHLTAPPRKLSAKLDAENLGPLFGLEMYRATRRAKITIDMRSTIRGGAPESPGARGAIDLARNETMNMRIFEATGCGVFLLAEHHENLASFFRSGWEIETYRSRDELVDKIRFYLKNPDLREAIAARGQQRCLRDHSMEKRAKAFADILHSRLDTDDRQEPIDPSRRRS